MTIPVNFAEIRDTVAKSIAPTIVSVPGEAPNVVRVALNGTLTTVHTSAPLRQTSLGDVDSLIAMALRIARGTDEPEPNDFGPIQIEHSGDKEPADPETVGVLVNDNYITLYLDLNDRREYFRVYLGKTAAFGVAENLEPADYRISQDDLYEALRYTLTDALPEKDRQLFLQQIKQVTWSTSETAEVSRNRTGESLGKSITAAVRERTDIGLPPEHWVLTLRRWRNAPVAIPSRKVGFLFDMDAKTRQFVLRPEAPEWESYLLGSVSDLRAFIADALRDTGIQVLLGE